MPHYWQTRSFFFASFPLFQHICTQCLFLKSDEEDFSTCFVSQQEIVQSGILLRVIDRRGLRLRVNMQSVLLEVILCGIKCFLSIKFNYSINVFIHIPQQVLLEGPFCASQCAGHCTLLDHGEQKCVFIDFHSNFQEIWERGLGYLVKSH